VWQNTSRVSATPSRCLLWFSGTGYVEIHSDAKNLSVTCDCICQAGDTSETGGFSQMCCEILESFPTFRRVAPSVTTGSSRQSLTVHDMKLLTHCTWDLHTSAMLRGVDRIGLTGRFETSVTNYQSTLRNIPEGWRCQSLTVLPRRWRHYHPLKHWCHFYQSTWRNIPEDFNITEMWSY